MSRIYPIRDCSAIPPGLFFDNTAQERRGASPPVSLLVHYRGACAPRSFPSQSNDCGSAFVRYNNPCEIQTP